MSELIHAISNGINDLVLTRDISCTVHIGFNVSSQDLETILHCVQYLLRVTTVRD